MSRSHFAAPRRRCLAAALAGLLATPACYRAPDKSGTDEVHDPNVEATALKDNGFAAKTWAVVDDYMEDVIGDLSGPGCAIGIARGGQLTYLKGYGKAKLGGEDWGVATVGAVGSVSKTFTAAGLLLMDQLGMVDVKQTVGAHAPSGNAALDSVVIEKLLSHTSGVGGATKDAAFAPTWEPGSDAKACFDGAPMNCVDVAKELRKPRLAYDQYSATEIVAPLAPGNFPVLPQGVYSNVGYSVAGAIIDELTAGTSYDGYEGWIWERIGGHPASDLDADNLLSLALTHSWRANDIPHRAVGYRPNGIGGYTKYEAFDVDAVGKVEGWEGPSGGWAMTIGDLTRFALALNTDQIVDNATVTAMRAVRADLDDYSDHAGMGMFVTSSGGLGQFGGGTTGQAPYWMGGQIGGHTAAWTWWDDANGSSLAIAMMCNRNDLSPFSLRDHTTALAALLPGTAPVMGKLALPVVELPRADGRSWGLDARGAWQATPTGALLPLTALRHDLVLRATVQSGRLALTLAEGTVTGSTATLATDRRPTALGAVTTSRNPWFSTAPTDVRLASSVGDVVVNGLVVSGAFADQTSRLASVSLTGTLDARQIGPLVGRSATSLCSELATTSTACQPCADGAPTCVAVRYDGYAGTPVTIR